MLSSLKPMSILTIILSIINAAGALLVFLQTSPYLDPNTKVSITAFLATTSITLLVIGISLLKFNDDMEANIESLNAYTATLKKRIEDLEKKI